MADFINIFYPEKESESEIEAMLWLSLRKHGVDARLQILAGDSHIRTGARLDIVCFSDKKAFCIIECKSWSPSYSAIQKYRLSNERQVARYNQLFGLPIFICGRVDNIEEITNKVLSLALPTTQSNPLF